MTKHYGAVKALSNGQVDVRSGEVVALIGANGSGKSTLSKIITGVISPNSGQMLLNGQVVSFASPYQARKRGITAVYQELSLIPDMTVAENIFLGHEPSRWGVQLRRAQMVKEAQALLELFRGSMTVSPHTTAAQLAPGERQVVEILKALSLNPRLLILDEATASLDSQQVDRLFELVRRWKGEGMAIIFVSHRMDEIFRIADRIVVLRNGETVGAHEASQTTEQALVKLMIGDVATVQRMEQPGKATQGLRLKASRLHNQVLQGLGFELHDGELLGLGGLHGQGQENLLRALFGAEQVRGTVEFAGKKLRLRSPRQAIRLGIAYVPGDRGREGLLMIRSILENLQLPSWGRYGIALRVGQARQDAFKAAQQLSLKMESLDAPVSSLSGGNAQKVVIGKWLLRKPSLLLLNDPTKGVDVGSKAEFYALLNQLRREGTAIFFYSSDDEELLALCDRILVMQDGRITAELTGESLRRSSLVAASMGVPQSGGEA